MLHPLSGLFTISFSSQNQVQTLSNLLGRWFESEKPCLDKQYTTSCLYIPVCLQCIQVCMYRLGPGYPSASATLSPRWQRNMVTGHYIDQGKHTHHFQGCIWIETLAPWVHIFPKIFPGQPGQTSRLSWVAGCSHCQHVPSASELRSKVLLSD
jgi:hypothetical protein